MRSVISVVSIAVAVALGLPCVYLHELVLPMAFLVPYQIIVSGEPALADGALVRSVLRGQMSGLVGGQVGVEVMAYGAFLFLSLLDYLGRILDRRGVFVSVFIGQWRMDRR